MQVQTPGEFWWSSYGLPHVTQFVLEPVHVKQVDEQTRHLKSSAPLPMYSPDGHATSHMVVPYANQSFVPAPLIEQLAQPVCPALVQPTHPIEH